jgi:hypothetical protein
MLQFSHINESLIKINLIPNFKNLIYVNQIISVNQDGLKVGQARAQQTQAQGCCDQFFPPIFGSIRATGAEIWPFKGFGINYFPRRIDKDLHAHKNIEC